RARKDGPGLRSAEPRRTSPAALMLILFDQGTPVAIRHSLPEHTIKTAAEQGWSTLLNGDLLLAAEGAGFELFLTTDTNIPFQQNLKSRKLAIVVLTQNRWK